jgi:hypothetical protein
MKTIISAPSWLKVVRVLSVLNGDTKECTKDYTVNITRALTLSYTQTKMGKDLYDEFQYSFVSDFPNMGEAQILSSDNKEDCSSAEIFLWQKDTAPSCYTKDHITLENATKELADLPGDLIHEIIEKIKKNF